MDYSECFVSQIDPLNLPAFPGHLWRVWGWMVTGFHNTGCREKKYHKQEKKQLFNDKWPNLFLPSNCGNLVQLCKSLSLLLWIGCFKWILTFVKARHGKLPLSSFGSGTPIFRLELQLFFPVSAYSHSAFAQLKESQHIEWFALQGMWCSN